MPPSISRAGAGACTTVPGQVRQASFGRRVTITRNCAGITSSRSEVSSPITVIVARQHGQAVSSGASVTSTRGKCDGSAPRLSRRLAALSLRSSGSCFSACASSLAIACSSASRPSCSCSSGRRSERVPKCIRVSFNSRWRNRSFCVSKVSRSVTAASRSANVASTSARRASTVSGRLCVLAGGESVTCESYAAAVGLRIPFIV
jgi:hypothetical protein